MKYQRAMESTGRGLTSKEPTTHASSKAAMQRTERVKSGTLLRAVQRHLEAEEESGCSITLDRMDPVLVEWLYELGVDNHDQLAKWQDNTMFGSTAAEALQAEIGWIYEAELEYNTPYIFYA